MAAPAGATPPRPPPPPEAQSESLKTCPDCQTPLHPIHIVDQRANGIVAVGFHYTRGAAPRTSAWSGKVQNGDGMVQGFLCDDCSRVRFYATPA